MQEKEIYAMLRYMREKFGYTQEHFARLIGCGTPNYANKERGRVPWKLDECKTLRDVINKRLVPIGEKPLTIDDLFHADIVSMTKQQRKKTG